MKYDFQKQKVYDWESKYISPKDKSEVDFNSVQDIVNYVWEQEGLKHPPKVEPIPKNTKNFCGKANRLTIFLHENATTPTWVILHEMAHSMTMTHDYEDGDKHRERFLGVYMQLLDRYLKIPLVVSMYTASQEGLRFDTTAKPVFLDDEKQRT